MTPDPAPSVYLTEPVHDDAVALLVAAGAEVIAGWQLDPQARAGALARAGAAIVRTAPFGADVLAAAPGLAIVAKHGVGVDNIDLAAARARGIAVTNTPEANAISVAEHALALLLALAKRLPQMDASVRAGTWSAGTPRPVELHGRRLTVLGFGRSGRRLAVAAAALGMKVTVHARSLPSGTTSEGFRATPSLAEALDGAEALSVHLPLGPSTRGLIGAAELARLAPGALVVNVARGGIVDESALVRAEHLGGVASDVFAEEPPPPGHPLLALEGAILTPHVAGVTEAALRRMGLEAAGSVVDFLAGRLDPARRLA